MTFFLKTGRQLCAENESDVEIDDDVVQEAILIKAEIVRSGN